MLDTIGVDVSKDRLDAFAFGPRTHRGFANDRTGRRALVRWARAQGCELVVFEPTGRYHRPLARDLAEAGLAYVAVDPLQARRFAEAEGRRDKTDRADARSLARMGAVFELEADPPRAEILNDLNDLETARRALVKDRTAARARRAAATLTLLRRQLDARLRQIETQIDAVEREIDALISAEPVLVRRRDILASITGIGQTTAATLVISMPELGTMHGKGAARLAGLAPVTRQSGKSQAPGRIGGGRGALRQALYMPALAAIRYNPEYNTKYQELTGRGKKPKQAVTAIMRKLVVLANALLRDNRTWEPRTA